MAAYCVKSIVVYMLRAVPNETTVLFCTAHSIYITMDLTQYAATPLHVYNDVFLPTFLTIVTLARFKYKLPDDGHRPKHVVAFSMNFNVNVSAF